MAGLKGHLSEQVLEQHYTSPLHNILLATAQQYSWNFDIMFKTHCTVTNAFLIKVTTDYRQTYTQTWTHN